MARNVLTESDTLTSHPARIRAATTSACPAEEARCRAFRPFCNKLIGNFTLEQAIKAQRGYTLSLTSALDGGW
jgi:hypothetical protein